MPPGTDAASLPSTPAAQETFTLEIAISGLCLLVRQVDADRLLILLPPAHTEHENGKRPAHRAVLGAHERYKPEGPFVQKGRFHECVLEEGTLSFHPDTETAPGITLSFPAETPSIADLTGVAGEHALVPARARVKMLIERGGLCADCANDPGGRWHFDGNSQHMATRVTWRIDDVWTRGSAAPAVKLVLKSKTGSVDTFVIHPVEKKAAFYLYHTPSDELPSHLGHPAQQEADPEVNHHFGAYYDLFEPRLEADLPEKVLDDDDGDDDEAGTAEPQLNMARVVAGMAAERVAAKTADASHRSLLESAVEKLAERMHLGQKSEHGRLYTCTVASLTQGAAASPVLAAGSRVEEHAAESLVTGAVAGERSEDDEVQGLEREEGA